MNREKAVKGEFRVIVCGGRDYGQIKNADGSWSVNKEEVEFLNRKLDVLLSACDITRQELVIIQGGARGADREAKKWAQLNNVECREYRADWDKHKKAAGFIRNTEMAEKGNPSLTIAFKGGTGTASMINISHKRGILVRDYR